MALEATNRPLWNYTFATGIFRCPADRGFHLEPFQARFSDTFRVIGTSYKYNYVPWWFYEKKKPEADPVNGIAGKPTAWVPDPSRFVLLHEPPALPLAKTGLPLPQDIWILWHFGRGSSTLFSRDVVPQKVIAPVLFADGHSAAHDFAKAVKSEWPAEPTTNWIGYKPAR
jgi:hypothetical protein